MAEVRPEDREVVAPKLTCPTCGLASEAIRCPRCDTLKVKACGSTCLSCSLACASRPKGTSGGKG